MKILVAGAGGFIGGHLVNDLIIKKHNVISVDRKPFHDWYQLNELSNLSLIHISEPTSLGMI